MATTTIRADTTERHVNKYTNSNPIPRLSLGRFYDAVAEEITAIQPSSVLDFGCGEGFILAMMSDRDIALPGYEGLDLRPDALQEAQRVTRLLLRVGFEQHRRHQQRRVS